MRLKSLLIVALMLAAVPAIGTEGQSLRFVTGALPPFTQEQQGEVTGPLPQIVMAVCKRLARDCSIRILPWRRVQHMVKDGDADGMFPVADLPVGENGLFVGRPIVQTGYSIFVSSGSPLLYRQPADLQGYTIGVPGPTSTSNLAMKLTRDVAGARVITEVNDITALKKLSHGHYGPQGAVIMNRDLAAALIKQEQLANLGSAGDIREVQYRIGLSRSRLSAEESEAFDKALAELVADGTVKRILATYGLRSAQPVP